MKLFEFGAFGEGFLADDFYRIGDDDRDERSTICERLRANLDDRDSVNMIRNHHRALETFVATDYAGDSTRDLPCQIFQLAFRRLGIRIGVERSRFLENACFCFQALVVDDEIDVFVERVARERFKGRGKDDSAKRKTIPEGPLADGFYRTGNFDALERATPLEGSVPDLFNPRSQMKFFESGAFGEGRLAAAALRAMRYELAKEGLA